MYRNADFLFPWRRNVLFPLLLLVIGFFYFWNLGSGSLRQWDEALSAERAREMVETGQWMTPQFGYEPDFNKPPLYYWLTAISFKTFGINEFSVRLWSVLFGLACIVLVYLLVEQNAVREFEWIARGGPSGGIIAAFILAANPHWINMTREGMLDSGMLFGMLSAVWLMNRGCGDMDGQGERVGSGHLLRTRGMYVLAGVCLAVGILTKGPTPYFAFAIPLWDRFVSKTRSHSLLNLSVTLVVSLAFAAPWFLYHCFAHEDAFYSLYISRNMIERFTHTIESHYGGPFFYLLQWRELAGASLILFSGALVFGALFRRRSLKQTSSFIFLALLLLFFLSIAGSKRDLYLLLIYPFAAIACGMLFGAWSQGFRLLWPRAVFGVGILLLCLPRFISSYDVFPDHDPSLKETALRIDEVARENEKVYSVNMPVNNLIFYAQRFVRYMPMECLQETQESFADAEEGDLFFVVYNKELAEFQEQTRFLLDDCSCLRKVIYRNGDHSIFLFQFPKKSRDYS